MRKLSVSLLASVLLLSSAGLGAPPSAADVARASKLADEGKKLLQDEKWAEAYEKFRQADQAVHNPTMVLHMARCKRKLGELLDAKALYDRVAMEKLEDDAPDRHVKAQADAKTEGADLVKKIPLLVLTAQGDGVAQLVVEVDGKSVAVGSGPVRLPMNPGTHTVKSTTPWGGTQTQPVTLTEGAETPLVLKVQRRAEPSPTGTAAVQPPVTAAPTGQTTTPTSATAIASGVPATPFPATSGPTPAAVAALSVGGAVGVAGAITGVLALTMGSAVLKSCAGDLCRSSVRADGQTAYALGVVSPIALGLGLAGMATGVALVLRRPAAGTAAPASGNVKLKAGAAWVGVEGDF